MEKLTWRPKMINRQAKFEAFLDAQILKQRKNWFASLPKIMIDMVDAINSIKVALKDQPARNFDESELIRFRFEKFESNTLSKLRPMYVGIKQILSKPNNDHADEKRTRELVGNMISQLNSWFRSSKIAVGLKQEMDPRYTGKASIAAKYELLISDDFNVTCNHAWQ